MVYAVEFSHRSGRDLINMAKKRNNVVPIIEDARHPHKYRMLVPMVDTIFADVAQPDQARIVAINAQYFLKNSGKFVISIKVSIHTPGRPTVTAGSDHHFRTWCTSMYVRRHFIKFQVRIVMVTGGTVGMAELIIHGTHMSCFYLFSLALPISGFISLTSLLQ